MEWISVKERLPDESLFEVLVSVDEPFFGVIDKRAIVGYYSHEEGQWRCDLTGKALLHVTHWRELPEPPKP